MTLKGKAAGEPLAENCTNTELQQAPYSVGLLTITCCICHIFHMPGKTTALNVRVVPQELIRKAKSAAALQGKTLREWIIEAVQEKLRRVK